MPRTVLTIGYLQEETSIHAMCRQLGFSVSGAASTATTGLELLQSLTNAPDLILANANASDVDITDLALSLSLMECKASIIFCGVACPRIQDTLLILAASLGLCTACTACASLSLSTLRNAVAEIIALRRQPLRREYGSPAASFDAAEIRSALLRGEFELHYQPKVRLIDGSLCGVEALLRWRHPQHGLLTPASFLQQAEAGGLVELLTTTVLQLALADAQTWHVMGTRLPISINLSPLALAYPHLADHILDIANRSTLSPSQLMFEITEYTEIANLSTALRNLLKLRLNGNMLSLDDYGAGHGSILQLSRIPFSELKADMRLVQGAWKRPHLAHPMPAMQLPA
jgi:EAL domain-containing protein (putative c-di-GMP-specific phosphodiesterase class I)